MRLFNSYLKDISDILNENRNDTVMCFSDARKSLESLDNINLNESVIERNLASTKPLAQVDNTELINFFGMNRFSFKSMKIGAHPDFKKLKFDYYEKYYCVSMFMDIKGSTILN